MVKKIQLKLVYDLSIGIQNVTVGSTSLCPKTYWMEVDIELRKIHGSIPRYPHVLVIILRCTVIEQCDISFEVVDMILNFIANL